MREGRRNKSPPAGVKDGQANYLLAFVADDDVLIGEFAVGGDSWLPEMHVKYIAFLVVRRPQPIARSIPHYGYQANVLGEVFREIS